MDGQLKSGHFFSRATSSVGHLERHKMPSNSQDLEKLDKTRPTFPETGIQMSSMVWSENQLINSCRQKDCNCSTPIWELLGLVTEEVTPSAPPFSYSTKLFLLHKQVHILPLREIMRQVKIYALLRAFLVKLGIFWMFVWNTFNLFGPQLSLFVS